MECIFQGMPDVAPYLDNVIITGKDDEEHLKNLSVVLEKISQAGLRFKRSKCQFMNEKMIALGHVLSGQGIQQCTAKVEAIQNAPPPSNVTELGAYLGLINYYHRYLRNLSSVLAPLHALLKKGIPWSWNASHQKAFDTSKQQLCPETLLVHYDLDKKLIPSCDASPYGVGAVLSHVMEDGSERPIGFASRTLAPAEKKYSQLDKEGLAIIFGIKKFHQHVYGRRLQVTSDHKLDDNNCVIRRHQDHIRGKTDRDDVSTATDIEQCAVRDSGHTFDLPPAPLPSLPALLQIDTSSQVVAEEETTTVKSPVRDVVKSVERRYPSRDRRPPVYYKDCN